MTMPAGCRVAVAIAVLAAAPGAALAADSALQTARYDAVRKVVVIPYRGTLPTYTMHALENPPRVYLDLKARAFVGPRSQEIDGHPSLVRLAMAPRGQAEARVTLTFKRPTRVRVVHNARRKQLLLVPESVAAARPTAGPEARQPAARLGLPRWDAERQALVLPLEGAMPAFRQATLPNPPRVYVDFQAAGPEGLQRGQADRVRWVMAGRGPGATRLTLTFERQTPVQLRHDGERREILLVPTFPEPAPGAPTLRPEPMPEATPAEVATPASQATPSEPVDSTPAATP